MKPRYLILILLITFSCIQGSNAVQVSTSYSSGGCSGGSLIDLSVPEDGTLTGSAIFGGSDGMEQSIRGTGSIKESHFVQNADGARAEISVNIVNSDYYDYRYKLHPGEGGGWLSKYVSAGEALTVSNASSISALAVATNSAGNRAGVLFQTSDDFGKTYAKNYSNYAEASKESAIASQWIESFSCQSNRRTRLVEFAQTLDNQVIHSLDSFSLETQEPYSLSNYSGAASARNVETSVIADYAQLNLPNGYYVSITDTTLASLLRIEKGAGIRYNLNQPQHINVDAYSTKASIKGKKATAESTIQVDGSPSNLEYLAAATPLSKTLQIDGPGTYTAMAEINGKKPKVNVEAV